MVDLMSTYTNGNGSRCLGPVPGTTTDVYTPPVPTVNGACFSSGVVPSIVIPIQLIDGDGLLTIPLGSVRLGGRYQLDPATGLTGLLIGFLSEADAASNPLPEALPLLGGEPMSRILRGGEGNGCAGDDRDRLDPTMPEGPTNPRGWWVYVAFTAQRIVFD
jgi:hypothetical protein